MTPPPALLSRSPVPPEGSNLYIGNSPSPEQQNDWSSVSFPDTDDYAWSASEAAKHSCAAEEYIPLEVRGVTSQQQKAPFTKKSAPRQLEIWKAQTIHKNCVAAKLREAGMSAEASTLENCHSYYTFVICNECGLTRKFPNRCDLFYCPECGHHLQAHAARQVEWWTKLIHQPKHVVLTIKNIYDLTSGHVDELRKMFGQLRRRKFCRNWDGGFYRIQCTNDGNGWHLHLHILVNAKWIDQDELKQQWLSVTRGFGYIVKVRDCRAGQYLHIVTQYVAKGSELAAWKPSELVTFIRAFNGRRTFGVFGKLYGARTKFAEFIASIRETSPKCECGSCNVSYYDEAQFRALSFVPENLSKPRPPPPEYAQIDLISIRYRPPG
jgi:hypothetical protein